MNDAAIPLLFSPIRLRSVTARNRIVASPMCQYLSDDGAPGDWQMVNFGRFAMSGTGIVFGEETAVEPRGRKTHHCAGIYRDSHIAAYRRINEFIKSLGSIPAIQLGHCGARASSHGPLKERAALNDKDGQEGLKPWQPLAPSALQHVPGTLLPREMDANDIRENLEAWRVAALRAVDAGFEICEVHGAHGYLIHQFLSPSSNKRTDGYGGDLKGRMRFALEVVETVRKAWPEHLPLFFRFSAVEGPGGEWGLDDTIVVSRELKLRGVDVIDCSSGGNIGGDSKLGSIPRVPNYQAGYAREVKRAADIPTMAVGLITDPHHAEAILRDGEADLIALARELMENPNWPVQAAKALGWEGAYGLVHAREAQRLRLREQHRREYTPADSFEVPFGIDEKVPYSWETARVEARRRS